MWEAVRSMWAEPAVPDRPRGARRDRVLAALVLLTVVVEVAARADLPWPGAAIGVGCAVAGAVLIRRTHCLAAVGLAFGSILAVDVTAVVVGVTPPVLHTATVVLLLVYSLFRWGAGRDLVLGSGIVAAGFIGAVTTDPGGPGEALGGAGVLLSAAALGGAVRYRAVAREQLVEQAKLHERAQLARELHDTVAHHVSAIAIQAQAGLVLARSASPAGAVQALEVIDREAGRTLTEMRAIVGALRDRLDEPSRAPQHHLADIEQLAHRGTDSLRVDVELRGNLTDLSPALKAALYRVAQESVTNAQRHAQHATRVEVTVTGNATEVELTVDDDGGPAAPGRSGYGLVGMTERVTLLGGTLTAGPRPDRGWRVHTVLPRPRRGT